MEGPWRKNAAAERIIIVDAFYKGFALEFRTQQHENTWTLWQGPPARLPDWMWDKRQWRIKTGMLT